MQVQFTGEDGVTGTLGEGEEMVRGLQGAQEGVDEKLQRSQIQFFQVLDRISRYHLSGAR